MDNKHCKKYKYFSILVILFDVICLGLSEINYDVVPKPVPVSGVERQDKISASTVTTTYDNSTTKKPAWIEDVKKVSIEKGVGDSVGNTLNRSPKDDDQLNKPDYDGKFLKPSRDDWYYDPDEPVENGEIWDEDGDEEETAIASEDGADDKDENDEMDDENYGFWSKFQDENHQNKDEDDLELDEESRQNEDVDERLLEDVVDESMAKKNKPPTAPSSMVLFYTWMILVILIMVIGISTYQARCKGFHISTFLQQQQMKEDRKRFVEHEYA